MLSAAADDNGLLVIREEHKRVRVVPVNKNLNAYEFVVSHIKNGNGEYDHQQIGSFMKIVNPQFAKSSYYLERCQ